MLLDPTEVLALEVMSAVGSVFDLEITPEQAVLKRAAPRRDADFQSNVAFPLASRLRMPPREIAAGIAAHLASSQVIEEARVEGGGFLNLVISRSWLERAVAVLAADPRLGTPAVTRPLRVVIDYGSPNAAKEMHVGHLRSTIIGDALARLLSFIGHNVVRQNHLGDFGTPFGMLIEHLLDSDLADADSLSITDLNVLYQEARRKFESDPTFGDRSRRRVVALQAGDPATRQVWKSLVEESKRHIEEVYDLLGVLLTPGDYRGESAFEDTLEAVVDELSQRGLLEVSEGALCAFAGGRDEGPPLIVRKTDGAYTYDTTDLAALRYRTQQLRCEWLIYVVGASQRLHFELLFALGRRAGWLPNDVTAVHVKFGSVLSVDGKMLRTRAGASLRLTDLIREGVERADALVAQRSRIEPEARAEVARAVGVGALKYADLVTDREKDYVFDWARMLAMDGNTAVYLQYANARVRSVIARAGGEAPVGTRLVLVHASERELAIKLLQFGSALGGAAETLRPHRICTYLYELAATFSGFYEECPILSTREELRASRLTLSGATSRILTLGLSLLGIEAPERL